MSVSGGDLPGAAHGGCDFSPLRHLLPALFVAVLAALPLLGALSRIGLAGLPEALREAALEPRFWRALGFSLRQAFGSALLALMLGLPGAWLVARYRFRGRRLLRALAAVPFCIPPILVVLAFVLYYGRNGYLNSILKQLLGREEPPLAFLYSVWGLVLAHGFYNFPIILESVSSVWESLPRDREEAARCLGAGRLRAFVTGTLPALAPAIAEASGLVFLFCFFSFVIVLVFGPLGGSTIEVEIYRLARLEGNGTAAAAFALIETACALLVVLTMSALGRRRAALSLGLRPAANLPRPRGWAMATLLLYGLILLIFFGGPLLALLLEALTVRRGPGGIARIGLGNFAQLFTGGGGLLGALADSTAAALPAATLALGGGMAIALLLRRLERGSLRRFVEAAASLPLAVSGVVAALGWSLLFPRGGLAVLIIVQAAAALPFVLKNLSAAMSGMDARLALAARTLGASRLRAFLEIELPALAPPLAASWAFAFSLSAGDATTPLLFGIENFTPLPLLVYRLAGAYRFPEACAAGILLAGLAGAVFFSKDWRPRDAGT